MKDISVSNLPRSGRKWHNVPSSSFFPLHVSVHETKILVKMFISRLYFEYLDPTIL